MSKHAPELSPRLALLAQWVPQGAALADVGTDHGYLPIALTLEGRLRRAVASDLRPGPLGRGRAAAERWGVGGRIDFRLCGGLSAIRPEEIDTISIAGMGGETICAILQAAPWTADGAHTLLLQPMTKAPELRLWLTGHGYAICRERLAEERGTLYPVLEARAGRQTLSPGRLWAGADVTADPLGDRHLIRQIVRLHMALAGVKRSAGAEKKAEGLRELMTALLALREEWRRANGT